MDENAINEWNIKIWCLKQLMKLYKKEKLIETNYLFHRNLQFQKFIKTSASVLPGCGTRIKLICTPANLFPQPPHSAWGNTTLANFNLHQPLISFLYMIPSCKQYWKDVQTVTNMMQSMKSHWHGIWLLVLL